MILEAFLAARRGIGVDIDPLATMISTVKVSSVDAAEAMRIGNEILRRATTLVETRRQDLERKLASRWDSNTRRFVNYWFALETQVELLALITEIEKIDELGFKTFFELVFSAIIITKSGGVSMAFDLAHTRPHRAKVVIGRTGEILLGKDLADSPSPRVKFLTKTLRSPLEDFAKRLSNNSRGLLPPDLRQAQPRILFGDAQYLPLDDVSVDLIVTSPPYAANAIDYMRAHKFSLVWLGYPISDLSQKRGEYIGGEAVTDIAFEKLPVRTTQVIASISALDEKKGRVLHRYYSEMTRVLQEMYRVLKPGKAAIVVVGSSTIRGRDTETQDCLADIGRTIGFQVPKIGVRSLDRNRRMLPAGFEPDLDSQIQQRMHEEYVIGYYKPEAQV